MPTLACPKPWTTSAPDLPATAAAFCAAAASGYAAGEGEQSMAKGQMRSNKEARKPKKAKVKTIAANPSTKGGVRGLENFKN
jgi:hypothetical protein